MRTAFAVAGRRRLANVVFVVASAESPPQGLAGVVDEVRVQFPWGSLLRLLLGGDAPFVSYLGSLLRPDGRLVVCLSLTDRDGCEGFPSLTADGADVIGRNIAAMSGGSLAFRRTVRISETMVETLHSTWAKRLGVGVTRPGWLLEFAAVRPSSF